MGSALLLIASLVFTLSIVQGKATYTDAGQLHVISSSVTSQSKEDVLYSLLLAQLAANAKASRTSISAWYEIYERTLPNIAWVTTSSTPFMPFTPSTDRVSLKSVITSSLADRMTPELQDVLARAFDTIQQLKTSDPVIEEFTKNAGDGKAYNIQVQLVDQSDGVVTVLQLYVTLTTSESAGSDIFLLHDYAKNAVQIQVAYESLTLNSDLYATIRQSIIAKLGPERIARFISKLFDDGLTI